MAAAVAVKTDATLRPPLKWAGGKRWLVPELRDVWRRHPGRRLVEPFVGGLAVALGLEPTRALLSDRNEHLINFYRWVQRGLVLSGGLLNERERFYAARSRFNELIGQGGADSREAAELFYYLNRTSFNGLCRFNRKGEFNVPFGRYERINYARDFLGYRPLLRGWTFTSGDFERLRIESDDLVYADPPYDVEFTSYSSSPFGLQEQERLARWLADLDVPVVASNQATPRMVALYESLGFRVRLLQGPRRISCNGDRSPAQEMLASRGVGSG